MQIIRQKHKELTQKQKILMVASDFMLLFFRFSDFKQIQILSKRKQKYSLTINPNIVLNVKLTYPLRERKSK